MGASSLPAAIGDNLPPIKDRLGIEYEEVIASADLLAARAAAIEPPGDDASLGAIADLTKEVAALVKRAEAARVGEKEPFLAGGREVDAFFRQITDRLGKTKIALEREVATYLRRKQEEERQRRLEEERRAREEAARRLREAEELERRARDEANRRVAEALQASADRAVDEAVNAEREARAAEKHVEAKAADMARTRGESSLATLTTFWTFEIVDLAAIPLEKLRPYIPRVDIEKAVRQHVRIHKDAPIPGVRIFEDTQARVV